MASIHNLFYGFIPSSVRSGDRGQLYIFRQSNFFTKPLSQGVCELTAHKRSLNSPELRSWPQPWNNTNEQICVESRCQILKQSASLLSKVTLFRWTIFYLSTFPRIPETIFGLTTVGRLPTHLLPIYIPGILCLCQIATADRKAGHDTQCPRSICATCLIQCRGRYLLRRSGGIVCCSARSGTAGGQNCALGILPDSWRPVCWRSDHQGIETKLKGGSGL